MSHCQIISRATYQPFRIESDLPRVAPAPPAANPAAHIMLIGAEHKSLHCSYEQLCAVPTPEDTYREATEARPGQGGNVSYKALPFAEVADLTRDTWSHILDRPPALETYALVCKSRKTEAPQQVMGRLIFDTDDPRLQVGVAFRSSHNGSIAPQWIGPSATTPVCTNGMFGGVSSKGAWQIRHTKSIGERIAEVCYNHANSVLPNFKQLREQRGRWETIPMGPDLFGAILGIAEIRGLIKPQICARAREYYWAIQNGGSLARADSRYNAQADGSLLSGFESVSAALQKNSVRNAFEGYAALSSLIDAISDSGGSVSGIPEIQTLDISYH
jgi:hypothetical protein